MQIKDKVIFVLIGIIAILILFLVHSCNVKQLSPKVKEKIVYEKQAPAPELRGKPDSVKVYKKINVPVYIVDSNAIMQLIAERDSLTSLLKDSSVTMTFSTDTVHPVTQDTLSITCDELKRQIAYSLKYAPREQKVITRTETIVSELTIWDKLYYSAIGFIIAEIFHFALGR